MVDGSSSITSIDSVRRSRSFFSTVRPRTNDDKEVTAAHGNLQTDDDSQALTDEHPQIHARDSRPWAMASAAGRLSEPEVLVHAKARLFPGSVPAFDGDPEADADATGDAGGGSAVGADADAYAVVDTQFAAAEWLAGSRIDEAVRASLAPFNHVRVGGGYPDLVGVRRLGPELLAVERFGDEPPLIAVEAKGYAGDGRVDTERGIVRAYDRLHEANAAYLAAPAGAITGTDRTLARELNVGVLGVRPDGRVEPLEVPRVVGNRTSDEATAIRFQASAQGVADRSFGLNHPKNYLGYALAHYAAGPTDELLSDYRVVNAVDDARRGAAFLDLVREAPDGVRLRPLGREVVRFALGRYGSVEAALEEFAAWHGSPTRFVDLAPAWGQLARRVLFAYPATRLLVEELQTMHDDGITAPSLVDLVEWLHVQHPSFTVELFVRGDVDVRSRVLTPEGDLRRNALTDGNVYHSPTVFQLKAICYHAGVLAERGAEPHRLDPCGDCWALREPV
jgi:hypothetical protein